MQERIYHIAEGLSALSNKIMMTAGAITGAGVGVSEAAHQAPLSHQIWLFPSGMDLAFEVFMVFLYGAIGALGAASINWILAELKRKKK